MKKSRLFEIIREEISGALSEAGLGDQISTLQKQKDAVEKQKAPLTKKEADLSKKIADLEKKQADIELKVGTQLEEKQINEDLLMEAPFIGGSLDFAYIDGKIEKGVLGKAIAKATQEIQNAFPEVNPDAAAQIVMSKKSRKSEKTPEPIKTALENIDDTLEAQADTFENINFLKQLKNSEEFSTDEQIAIESYIEKATTPDEKTGKVKQYTYNLGFPQTLRAVEKTLSGEAPSKVEPTATPKPTNKPAKEKEPKKEEPKKATLTKGDDGFDDVSYSKSKKEEPKKEKESSEEKAIKAAKSRPKLDKISDDRDKLLKALKKAKEERLAVAEKRKNTKDEAEREKLFNDLKKINKLEGELQNKLDKFKF